MRLDDCLKVINRRIRVAQEEIVRRQSQGLQVRPWQHRIEELEAVRREIAALATPEALRTAAPGADAPHVAAR
jgi:hypothetical protein